MRNIISEVIIERSHQDKKWGQQNHKPEWWMQILMEEVGEASKAILDAKFANHMLYRYRNEMIQVAAVAIAAIESFDREKQYGLSK